MLALSSLVFVHFFIIVNKEHFSCSFFFVSTWNGKVWNRYIDRIPTVMLYLIPPENTWYRDVKSDQRQIKKNVLSFFVLFLVWMKRTFN